MEMARSGEPGRLRSLQGHGRALALGAVEDELLVGRIGELPQQTVRLKAFLHIGIGHMQRAGDDAVAAPFLGLAEIDQR
jgi:hypothetical protein